MENAQNVRCVKFTGTWNDMGTWNSVWRQHKSKDGDTFASGDIFHEDCEGSLLYSENKNIKLIALGLKDMVIVATSNEILVSDRDKTDNIKEYLGKIDAEKNKIEFYRKQHKPWGFYTVLAKEEKFCVKTIYVKPHSRLSLQKHKFRSEHWVVVRGKAFITINEKSFELIENQSTYVPLGAIHRLENKSDSPLVITEIQSGSYLGEDDIERLEDDYSRILPNA